MLLLSKNSHTFLKNLISNFQISNYSYKSCIINQRTINLKFYSQKKLLENLNRNIIYTESKNVYSLVNYILASVISILGLGFAAVPLFNAYCNATGYAGTIDISREKTKNLQKIENRELTIQFNADKSSFLQWNFKPLQSEIKCVPGETVLAFYTAENPTDKRISGISTYNVVPFEAAKYFNKIQCFCFDEQQLNPHEQVDMPVFFYIDPEYATDPYLYGQNNITLSYTFFEAIEGLELPFMSRLNEE